ncbi:permease [Candidatus Desantisbacteria bacterium CG07_land_8_20_14_0_80_39_15]|uniref:Probable membrane transporter protein n=3 Tax=unclassified Candidatus Desantisiibacteriota TaxID=3106372 RepID=A0A2H9PAQ5_9BACT|nr:MAG: permease [Candidatus Desantisbacteria bacterium CG07_land_8_20_14_0_80_39_15]PIZ15568.1 MAG: permease [Candidatus Desantisbacteria bacterium CG_4_10_14_0_8_um_filter_39_17]
MQILSYIILGLTAGVLSGFMGIGGGVIIIPILVYVFGLTQIQAQGTSLAALLPPIGLLAFLRYYYSGNADLKVGLLIAAGFFFGGLLGAIFAQPVPDVLLKRIFGIFLLIIAVRMCIGK